MQDRFCGACGRPGEAGSNFCGECGSRFNGEPETARLPQYRFVVIDVETANADLASICQIGVVAFVDGQVEQTWQTLVDPEDFFDGFNVRLHGIDESTVKDAPTFPLVAKELQKRLHGSVVVSHRPFDRVALSPGPGKVQPAVA